VTPIRQTVEYISLGERRLEELLKLRKPVFTRADLAFRQLNYIEKYTKDLGCLSVAIERHYIDRDYMEDHSVFYSRNLFPYPNSCMRVHFFKCDPDAARDRLHTLVQCGRDVGAEAFRTACREFSQEAYLGFMIVRPLPGCPVGRTVLRCFDENAQPGLRRSFSGIRTYTVHLSGAELTVEGLAFQQQDVGVSACATTALWSAIQKVRDFEDIGAATPAQITNLAAQHGLPFGRAMPSEGLSVGQMCQAIQSLGVSPSLFRVDRADIAKGYLYAALTSGFAPVLILREIAPANAAAPVWHAVTIAGIKERSPHIPTTQAVNINIDEKATDLVALYVHDDRYGPYVRAELKAIPRQLHIEIEMNSEVEEWDICYILLPTHSKIRLSFAALREASLEIVKKIHAYREAYLEPEPDANIANPLILMENWVARAHKHVESLFLSSDRVESAVFDSLATTIPFPRYAGVVRLSADYFGRIDILLDTTSTSRNMHCLAVYALENRAHTSKVIQHLSQEFDCPLIE
jgi:hypothetical protein